MSSCLVGVVSGALVDVSAPTPDAIELRDVAQGLAHISRWGGQLVGSWSVAEHSLFVTLVASLSDPELPPRVALAALLHDAHEAYIGDVVTPLKAALGDAYAELRIRLDGAIAARFGLEPELFHAPAIVNADAAALHLESAFFRPNGPLLPEPALEVRDLMERAIRDGRPNRILMRARNGRPSPPELTASMFVHAVSELELRA